MNFDEKIVEKLLEFFDQETGDQKSIQGELYRKYYGIINEDQVDEWIAYKYRVNLKGYL